MMNNTTYFLAPPVFEPFCFLCLHHERPGAAKVYHKEADLLPALLLMKSTTCILAQLVFHNFYFFHIIVSNRLRACFEVSLWRGKRLSKNEAPWKQCSSFVEVPLRDGSIAFMKPPWRLCFYGASKGLHCSRRAAAHALYCFQRGSVETPVDAWSLRGASIACMEPPCNLHRDSTETTW